MSPHELEVRGDGAEDAHSSGQKHNATAKMEDILTTPPPSVLQRDRAIRVPPEGIRNCKNLTCGEEDEVHPEAPHSLASAINSVLCALEEGYEELANGFEELLLHCRLAKLSLHVIDDGTVIKCAFDVTRLPAALTESLHGGRGCYSIRCRSGLIKIAQNAKALREALLHVQDVEKVEHRNESEHGVRGEHRRNHRWDNKPHSLGVQVRELPHANVGVARVRSWHTTPSQGSREREATEHIQHHCDLQTQQEPTCHIASLSDNLVCRPANPNSGQELIALTRADETTPNKPTLPCGQMHICGEHIC
mmetsp:Transcript_7223/g.18015  ORF Transcript_7223/g.18015 Transcript_7223/m.18015 type:complete len:306 (-) Transcript_7223:698-1615(-)